MRSIQAINEKIKKGTIVVLTKSELTAYLRKKGFKKTFRDVDVVTTATFGPMCSSGIYFNTGHTTPRIKFGGGSVTLQGIPCYAAFAAVDLFLGATALSDNDPRNSVYPGKFVYGGGHVIQDLVAGKDLALSVTTYGTDCYPRKEIKTQINIRDLNEAILFNTRNCYQNYNVAVNSSKNIIYTYMGMLKPNLGNANYCSAASLNPLLCDPYYRTIGIGTKIFLGGAPGFVTWWGTQHNPTVPRTKKGIPLSGSGTLALIGNLKEMNPQWLIGTSIAGYGVSLSVGIGIPIPILDEKTLEYAAVQDEDILAPIVDYSKDYPQLTGKILGTVTYEELKSGSIIFKKKKIPTGSLSSLRKAEKISNILKEWIHNKKFFLTQPVAKIPDHTSGYTFRMLKERPLKKIRI